MLPILILIAFSRQDYSQVDETDPFLPAPQASQAVAARTLQGGVGTGTLSRGPPHHHRSQGSYNRDNKNSLHCSDPPPSYDVALMHEISNKQKPNKEKASGKYSNGGHGGLGPPASSVSLGGNSNGVMKGVAAAPTIFAPSAPSPYQYFDEL